MIFSSIPTIWPTAVLALLATTLLLRILYRLLFHPLKSFPGPWTHKVTDLPSAWKLSNGEQHSHYHRLAQKYGSVVRVAPNELLFTGPDAWEDIYGYRVCINSCNPRLVVNTNKERKTERQSHGKKSHFHRCRFSHEWIRRSGTCARKRTYSTTKSSGAGTFEKCPLWSRRNYSEAYFCVVGGFEEENWGGGGC